MHVCRWVVVAAWLLGSPASIVGQSIGVDSASAAATASLRPEEDSTMTGEETRDSTRRRNSRVGPAFLGFLAGAGAGLVIAHVVNQTQDHGEGKLETYIGLPLILGLFSFATVFVALGD